MKKENISNFKLEPEPFRLKPSQEHEFYYYVQMLYLADKVGLNRCSVMLCLKKFKEGGIENALFDAPGRGRNAEITEEEKAWIINIACQKPIDFGYAAETWTYAKLISHINKTAEAAGYTRLSTIHKSTVNTILDEEDIMPHSP